MKKLFTLCFLMIIASLLSAQAPPAFKYQAIARNLNGDPVINQDIAVKISILSGSETGPTVYSELHEIPTNQMGLFTLEIGNAILVLSGNFSEIGWSNSTHFLKTEIDITGGSNYQLMGVSQLLSVPYALYANEAGNAENYTAGAGINVSNGVISNTAPDQNVTIAPGTGISTSGNYPNFMVTNSAPDKIVVLNNGTGISATGTYPIFTISNTSPNAAHTGDASGSNALTVTGIQGRMVSNGAPSSNQVLQWDGTRWMPSTLAPYTAGTGINISNNVVTNTSPDQNVTITSGIGISATGTYPNFTLANSAPNATHTGDATGGSSLTVVKIQGKAVSATAPALNQVLQWNGTTWTPVTLSAASSDWTLTGNAGTSPATNFIGTTDNVAFKIKVNNQQAGWLDPSTDANSGFGYQTLKVVSTGKNNSAFGYQSLENTTTGNYNTASGSNALFTNTEGGYNSAYGYKALYLNATGERNTAVGTHALYFNTAGGYNSAFGYTALYKNTSGNNNTAGGDKALYNNTTGYSNVAIGTNALWFNSDRSNLVAIGDSALYKNGTDATSATHATRNTAVGSKSLYSNTNGSRNTATGDGALYANTTGIGNTAVGSQSQSSNTTGNYNTATGTYTLFTNSEGDNNSANGYTALYKNTTGSNNTANGYRALYNNTTGRHNSANGNQTLYNNTLGYSNVAVGTKALFCNTVQSNLVAVGDSALYNNGLGATGNTEATGNTAVGSKALFDNTTGHNNTATGDESLFLNTSGDYNSAFGHWALHENRAGSRNTANGHSALDHNYNGDENTASGYRALYSNLNGNNNSAFGNRALDGNDTGNNNSAFGSNASNGNTIGYSNVAIGVSALFKNTVRSNIVAIGDSALFNNGVGATSEWGANDNTAIGSKALYYNTTGSSNTASGFNALYYNATGDRNTANGGSALYFNTTGNSNTGFGLAALFNNQTGNNNTAIGEHALYSNTEGNDNTATGLEALHYNDTGHENTANGAYALQSNYTGSFNTAVGYNTGMAGTYYGYSNVTLLGIDATATGNNMVRIGNTFVTSIGGYQNWTNISDSRVKENVIEDVPGLSFITKLRPVTFQLNREKINEFIGLNDRRNKIKEKNPDAEFLEGEEYSQVTTGFLAQEVEAAAKSIGFEFSGVDAPKNENDMYGLRYAEFVVPLVKAVQEQQVIISSQQNQITELLKQNEDMLKRIELLEKK
jgi:hypothetical protein